MPPHLTMLCVCVYKENDYSSVVEFKHKYTNDILLRTCCFSKLDGGVIYIGVNDYGGIYSIKDADGTMCYV